MSSATFSIWRGAGGEGKFVKYTTEISDGMVVLDAVHNIQAEQANDMSVRWNCKAGKRGSCSAEINGVPRLMCMTRLNELPLEKPVMIEPMKTFPSIKDPLLPMCHGICGPRNKSRNSSRVRTTRRMEAWGVCNKKMWIAFRN